MMRRTAQLRAGLVLSLSLAACGDAAAGSPTANAANEGRLADGYAAELESGGAWFATLEDPQPMVDTASSPLPPHCAQRALSSGGASFFVDGSYFSNGAVGLAFGPLAFLMPSTSLTAGPAASTKFFLGINLSPPPVTNQQLGYPTPLDPACGF
jgi:hypothetical protein